MVAEAAQVSRDLTGTIDGSGNDGPGRQIDGHMTGLVHYEQR